MNVCFLLFDEFETLDLFGPAEIFGKLEGAALAYSSFNGGLVKSAQGSVIETQINTMNPKDVLLIPGGPGTRALVKDASFIENLKTVCLQCKTILTVCTGSALLAKTGLLDGLKATSNKRAFEWVKSVRPEVNWQPKARWIVSNNIYTSSGVSAGMDMSLGFIADCYGYQTAKQIAQRIEYLWNENCSNDPFATS